ncbi:cytochrome c [Marimonas sp. MJW-29]|uniref:Cytochrome c n=1 Tax=Sulfitobacter sediminis TaxID=3234186 RepID=A0ABV3RPR6_9RHOB
MRKGLVVALGLSFAASVALAHTGVKNMTVMKRMEAMQSMGDSTKVLGQMAKGERTFNAETARAAALAIARHAAETPVLFEERAEDPKDEAKPVIWEQFEDFATKSEKLEKVAMRLAGSVESVDDVRAGLGEIGAACKACHEVYRE